MVANAQISLIFDRVICLPHGSGRVISFPIFIAQYSWSKNELRIGPSTISKKKVFLFYQILESAIRKQAHSI